MGKQTRKNNKFPHTVGISKAKQQKVKKLKKELAECRNELKRLEDAVAKQKRIITAFESLPQYHGYIKDKNGIYLEAFGEPTYLVNPLKPQEYTGKNDLELFALHKRKGAVSYTNISCGGSLISCKQLYMKIECEPDGETRFLYKEKDNEEWILFKIAQQLVCAEEYYIGLVLQSAEANNPAEFHGAAYREWAEKSIDTNWSVCTFNDNLTKSTITNNDEVIKVSFTEGPSQSGLYIYKKVAGSAAMSFRINKFTSVSANPAQVAGIAVKNLPAENSEGVNFLYYPKCNYLQATKRVKKDYMNKNYMELLSNIKQDQELLASGKPVKEELSWNPFIKVPFYNKQNQLDGMIAVFSPIPVKEKISSYTEEAVVVFDLEGKLLFYNENACSLLMSRYIVKNLFDCDIKTLYVEKRICNTEFEEILQQIRGSVTKYCNKDPVRFENIHGETCVLAETFFSSINYKSGLIDRIVLVLKIIEDRALLHEYKNHKTVDYRIKAINDYFNQHFDENVPMPEMIDSAGYNYNSVKQVYKKETGVSLKRALNHRRLDEACRLLVLTDLNIIDITLKCGFGSHRSFCRKFKEAFNTTPGKYRMKKRG